MIPASANAKQWLVISMLSGVGAATLNHLARTYQSPFSLSTHVVNDPLASRRLRAIFADPAALERAERLASAEITRLAARDAGLICYQDSEYPEALRVIDDFPVLLFYRGDLQALACPRVAVVGSRKASSYGLECAYRLGAELVDHGIAVVSGVAAGIDGAAHRGALAGNGPTIGVLGCGLDVVYPRGHGRLYDQIAEQGLLVSEYPCGTRPDGFRFPARNRIISGLSRAVVVVEATLKSGSLITARLALDQGREVFAVPGRIDSPVSTGTHALLRDGAYLVESGKDIALALDLEHAASPQDMPAHEQDNLDAQARQVLACLDAYGADIDAITRQVSLPDGLVAQLLLQLELAGYIRQEPGQIYVRTGRQQG